MAVLVVPATGTVAAADAVGRIVSGSTAEAEDGLCGAERWMDAAAVVVAAAWLTVGPAGMLGVAVAVAVDEVEDVDEGRATGAGEGEGGNNAGSAAAAATDATATAADAVRCEDNARVGGCGYV